MTFELTPNTDSESLGIEERPETLGGPKGPEHRQVFGALAFSETRRVQSPWMEPVLFRQLNTH
jgi:hypothetical protein